MTAPLDLTGRQFGLLTVLHKVEGISTGGWNWRCRCECGTLVIQRAAYLTAGRRKSCGCLPLKEKMPRPASHILHRFWDKIQRLAKRRGITFNVSAEYAQQIFNQQQGKCALSGTEISLPSTGQEARYSTYTASLDRIDSTKPYTEGNIQWVHKKVNMMKQNMSDAELKEWCAKIVSHSQTKVA